MDDYVEPKDTKKFQWGDLKTHLSTNHYSSDDEDDDDYNYSEPYRSLPGPGGPMWTKLANPPPACDDIYEIAPSHATAKSVSDYDVPPSPVRAKITSDYSAPSCQSDVYSHLKLNGTSLTEAVRGKSGSDNGDHSDSEDSYNHTTSWMVQKAERQSSSGSSVPSTPNKLIPGTPTTNTSRQNSNDSLSGTSPGGKHSPILRSPPQEGLKSFTRQRVIYPRKSSSSGVLANTEGVSQESSGPAIYEEAWDTTRQQKKLEENLRLARSISACSETFEDALEYLPDDWAPTRPKSGAGKLDASVGGEKTINPVTGGDYEPAWDLNRRLEEKLRSLQVSIASSDSRGGGGDDSNYQMPWDLPQKQRELEERIQRARAGGGHGNVRSPQHQPHYPHQQQQHSAAAGQQKGGTEMYEVPWDTRKGLAHMFQSTHSVECPGGSPGSGGSPRSSRSSQSIPCTFGEPINAMIPLNNQEWYHGNISRDDAERMLRVCKDGSYLVRDSSDRCHYTLSIKSPTQTIHIQIDQCQKADGSMRYILGKNSKAFPTIPSMIDYYTHHVVPIKGADHMTLLYPVHCKYSGGEESLA